jgi:hypothetical protein
MFAGVLTHAGAQGIYTCVDAKGRRLTADRPIAECVDREQRELSPGGIVRRKIGPTLTAEERAAEEEKARAAVEERNRALDEKRRDRALLTRYPTRAVHDKERATALAQIDEIIATAMKRSADLVEERRRLDAELEFFKADPSKVPGRLKRQLDENAANQQAQKRFVADQEQEKERVNLRFDQELARLKELWPLHGTPATAARAPASAKRLP